MTIRYHGSSANGVPMFSDPTLSAMDLWTLGKTSMRGKAPWRRFVRLDLPREVPTRIPLRAGVLPCRGPVRPSWFPGGIVCIENGESRTVTIESGSFFLKTTEAKFMAAVGAALRREARRRIDAMHRLTPADRFTTVR